MGASLEHFHPHDYVILIHIAEIVGSHDFGAFDLQQFIKDPDTV